MSHFRFPDGVEYLGVSSDEVRFNVSMPTDDDGHFGRECPDCSQIFRVSADDYDALPDDLTLWCVYCGHSDDHSEFITQQQMERATRAAYDYASQLFGQMLDDTFGGMARRSRNNSFVKISYRSTPFYPEPLPGINEESLIRERICERCRLHYAVYGEHRFCPVCGPLPAMTVALDAIAADETRLDALANLPAEALRPLRESGVLDRTYADTIENVVGTVETLAEQTFHELVPNADALLRGRGKIFQRLNDFADLYRDHLQRDIRLDLGDSWADLEAVWAARHILTHNDGIVDHKYLASVSSSSLREGQRLRVDDHFARRALDIAERLCFALTNTYFEA
jgi:hypothetical protein